jgi:hypothetical protein
MNPKPKPWFGQKWIGIGIRPVSWEGWLAVLAYVVAMGLAAVYGRRLFEDPHAGQIATAGLWAATTLALLVLMGLKGDGRRMRWRWGGKD